MNIGFMYLFKLSVLFLSDIYPGTARPHGSSICNILRSLHTTFYTGCANQQCTRSPPLYTLTDICYLCSF